MNKRETIKIEKNKVGNDKKKRIKRRKKGIG